MEHLLDPKTARERTFRAGQRSDLGVENDVLQRYASRKGGQDNAGIINDSAKTAISLRSGSESKPRYSVYGGRCISKRRKFKKKRGVPPQKRATAPAETHAGDMQKLYLTAHAQCRGATKNVNPQKYDRLCSSKRVIFHHYGIEHTGRHQLEEEETLYTSGTRAQAHAQDSTAIVC